MTECTEAIQTIIECIHYICFKKILKWTKRNITGNRQLQYHAILYEALPEWQVTRIVVGFAEGSSNLAGIIWFFSIVLFGIPKVYCWLFLKKDGYCKDRRFCSCKDFLQTAIRTKGSLCLRYNFSAFGDMVYIDGTMKLGGLGWPLSASSFFKAEVLSPENVFFPIERMLLYLISLSENTSHPWQSSEGPSFAFVLCLKLSCMFCCYVRDHLCSPEEAVFQGDSLQSVVCTVF